MNCTQRRSPVSFLGAVAALSILATHAVAAPGIGTVRVPVETHPSQGDIQEVAGAEAKIARLPEGIFANVRTTNLTPGNAYTLWLVAINAPEECADAPCKAKDVLGASDLVRSDLGFGDGAIAGPDGSISFTAFQPVGEMAKPWFGHGLESPDAEIHLVIRDHGPLVMGTERQMLSSFRAGCSEETVSESLPETARMDGVAGDYACANVQMAIFAPAE